MIAPEERDHLIARARAARENAYAPYSGYPVGAALLTDSGQVFVGANVENAAYPSGMCAERAAVFAAVSAGQRRFRALAVVTRDGGSPCGACRQVLAEFGLEVLVIAADLDGRFVQKPLGEWLPDAFGPANLSTAPESAG